MSILVIGATGNVGSQIVQRLSTTGVDVKALVREGSETTLPAGVTKVVGDLTSAKSMRSALSSVKTLFLLNAVVPDEVTQALMTLNLAKAAGIERIVYLSVINSDTYTDVPHFTGKHTVERMIETLDLPVTILRPAYYMQNDVRIKDVVESYGIYPMPIGKVGVYMVDVRDIADVAVAELLARHGAPTALPRKIVELVGPDGVTGESAARIWSEALGREIKYGGDDLDAFEAQLAQYGPDWLAFDMRLMMAGIQSRGQIPAKDAQQAIEKLLGRAPRTYRDYVRELTNKN